MRPHKSLMEAVRAPLDAEKIRIAQVVQALQAKLDEFEDQYPDMPEYLEDEGRE